MDDNEAFKISTQLTFSTLLISIETCDNARYSIFSPSVMIHWTWNIPRIISGEYRAMNYRLWTNQLSMVGKCIYIVNWQFKVKLQGIKKKFESNVSVIYGQFVPLSTCNQMVLPIFFWNFRPQRWWCNT